MAATSTGSQPQCHQPCVHQVMSVTAERAVGRTAKQMMLITSSAVFARCVSKTKEEHFNKLHTASVNYIPLKKA